MDRETKERTDTLPQLPMLGERRPLGDAGHMMHRCVVDGDRPHFDPKARAA